MARNPGLLGSFPGKYPAEQHTRSFHYSQRKDKDCGKHHDYPERLYPKLLKGAYPAPEQEPVRERRSSRGRGERILSEEGDHQHPEDPPDQVSRKEADWICVPLAFREVLLS